jgi:hypothetical protein
VLVFVTGLDLCIQICSSSAEAVRAKNEDEDVRVRDDFHKIDQ